jgi:hypothetical protein
MSSPNHSFLAASHRRDPDQSRWDAVAPYLPGEPARPNEADLDEHPEIRDDLDESDPLDDLDREQCIGPYRSQAPR